MEEGVGRKDWGGGRRGQEKCCVLHSFKAKLTREDEMDPT